MSQVYITDFSELLSLSDNTVFHIRDPLEIDPLKRDRKVTYATIKSLLQTIFDARYINTTGDGMTNNLNMNSNEIQNAFLNLAKLVTDLDANSKNINSVNTLTATNSSITNINNVVDINSSITNNINLKTNNITRLSIDNNGINTRKIKMDYGVPTGTNTSSAGYCFDGDSGMFSPSDGIIVFYANNKERMLITDQEVIITPQNTTTEGAQIHMKYPDVSNGAYYDIVKNTLDNIYLSRIYNGLDLSKQFVFDLTNGIARQTGRPSGLINGASNYDFSSHLVRMDSHRWDKHCYLFHLNADYILPTSSTVITFNASDVTCKVVPVGQTEISVGSSFTIPRTGKYEISYTLLYDFTQDDQGVDHRFCIRRNNSALNGSYTHTKQEIASSGMARVSMTLNLSGFYPNLTAGDIIDLYMITAQGAGCKLLAQSSLAIKEL